MLGKWVKTVPGAYGICAYYHNVGTNKWEQWTKFAVNSEYKKSQTIFSNDHILGFISNGATFCEMPEFTKEKFPRVFSNNEGALWVFKNSVDVGLLVCGRVVNEANNLSTLERCAVNAPSIYKEIVGEEKELLLEYFKV